MLLPAVLPAVAAIRADTVSRVYVNIEIGGSGGDRLSHPCAKIRSDPMNLIFHDGRFFALVNQKWQTLRNRVLKIIMKQQYNRVALMCVR